MRKFTLSIFLLSFALAGYSTTWTVVNDGFSFSPSTLTINEGDTVVFSLAGEHNSVEVSQTTWNMNGNTPLPGGWALPFGGGMVLPADLTEGTHWFVCQPHASGGMKGMIIVQGITSTDDNQYAPNFSVYPNPSTGIVSLLTGDAQTGKDFRVEIYDINGNTWYSATNTDQQTLNSIDLSNAAKGMYIIRLYDDKGIRSRKLIIQ